MTVKKITLVLTTAVLLLRTIHAAPAPAGPFLIALGSISGLYEDFAKQTAGLLENGVPGNRFGGIGSALTYLGGDFFLALPDRGPNAASYESCLDNTTSFINRFHTLHLSLSPSDPGSVLPFTLTPMLADTTLLSSRSPLVYGAGCGVAGSGVPALNRVNHTYYFTGRSDNFDPSRRSTFAFNGRFDAEGIRASNDLRHVYMTDEYGPYVYEFDRVSGERTRVFELPLKFASPNLSAQGAVEIQGNTVGRVANKGMEGLAITPDGKTLVGAMQSPLAQDGGDIAGGITRIVTIDIRTGRTHEYAYQLDTAGKKTTVSEILAINDHEFLVDERDSKGRADEPGSKAAFKKLYRIDLEFAQDVSRLSGQSNLAPFVLTKTLFLDIVEVLTADPLNLAPTDIPAKLEGISFGQDVTIDGVRKHTLYVANDNDFLASFDGAANPNQFFVFAFDDNDLPFFVPQQFKADDDHDRDGRDHDDRDRDDGRGR